METALVVIVKSISVDETEFIDNVPVVVIVPKKDGGLLGNLKKTGTGRKRRLNKSSTAIYDFSDDSALAFDRDSGASNVSFDVLLEGDDGTQFEGRAMGNINKSDGMSQDISFQLIDVDNDVHVGDVETQILFKDIVEETEEILIQEDEENIHENITSGRDEPADSFEIGDRVEARYKGGSRYFAGRITSRSIDGTYYVRYDDGDEERDIPARYIRKEGGDDAPRTEEHEHEIIKKKKRKPGRKLPEWVPQINHTNSLGTFIRDSLDAAPNNGHLKLLFHSVVCTGTGGITACVKTTLFPTPGESVTVRSVGKAVPYQATQSGNKTDNDSTNASIVSNDLLMEIFNLAGKQVDIALTEGELRSKIFREGACPVVEFEFQSKTTNASAALYLPSLVSMTPGRKWAVPLTVNEHAWATAGGAKHPTVIVILEIPDNSNNNPQTDASYEYIDMLGPVDCLELDIKGLIGEVITKDGLYLEAKLPGNDLLKIVPAGRDQSFKGGFSFDAPLIHAYAGCHLPLETEVLQLSLKCNDNLESSNKPLGVVDIPLNALFTEIRETSPRSTPLNDKILLHPGWTESDSQGKANSNARIKRTNWALAISLRKIQSKRNRCIPSIDIRSINTALQEGIEAEAIAHEEELREQVEMRQLEAENKQQDINNNSNNDDEISNIVPSSAPRTRLRAVPTAGTIYGVIHGFLWSEESNNSNLTTTQMSFEVKVIPNDNKISSSSTTASINNLSNAGVGVFEWNQGFKLPLTWSVSERVVGMMKFSVFINDSNNTNKQKNGKTAIIQKQLVGSATLDLASFNGENGVSVCSIPVYSGNVYCGNLLTGFKFVDGSTLEKKKGHTRAAGKLGSHHVHEEACSKATKDAWQRFTTSSGLHKALAVTQSSGKQEQLHCTLENLDFSVDTIDDLMLLVVSGVGTKSVHSIERINGIWSERDLLIPEMARPDLCNMVCLQLYSKVTDDKLGEANISLDRSRLQAGIPVSYVIPLADKKKERVALVNLSVQMSAVEDISSNMRTKGGTTDTMDDHGTSNGCLEICIDEGLFSMDPKVIPTHPVFQFEITTSDASFSSPIVLSPFVSDIYKQPWDVRRLIKYTGDRKSRAKWVLKVRCLDAGRVGTPCIAITDVVLSKKLLWKGLVFNEQVPLYHVTSNAEIGSLVVKMCDYTFHHGEVANTEVDGDRCSGLGRLLVKCDGLVERAGSLEDVDPLSRGGIAIHGRTLQLNDNWKSTFTTSESDKAPNAYTSIPVPVGLGKITMDVVTSNSVEIQTSVLLADCIRSTGLNNGDGVKIEIPLDEQGINNASIRCETVFVPFVEGALTVLNKGTTMKIPGFEGNAAINSNILREDASVGGNTTNAKKNVIFRFSMAGVVNEFGQSFEPLIGDTREFPQPSVKHKKGPIRKRMSIMERATAITRTGSNGSLQVLPTNSPEPVDPKIARTIHLPVNTAAITSHKNDSRYELDIHLLEADAAIGEPARLLGVGKVSTASLYYDALKMAAKAPLDELENLDNTKSSAIPVTIELRSPVDDKLVAETMLDIQFQIHGVEGAAFQHATEVYSTHNIIPTEDNVNKFMETTNGENTTNMDKSGQLLVEDEMLGSAKLEMSLKRTFTAADTDRSGDVDCEEMVQLIRKVAQRQHSLDLDQSAVTLLLDLAKFHSNKERDDEDDNDGMVSEDLEDAVRAIYSDIDIDSGQSLSWWEWRQFLGGALRNRGNLKPDFLVIKVGAAATALQQLYPEYRKQPNSASNTTNELSGNEHQSLRSPDKADLDNMSVISDVKGLPPARAVGRLQLLVQSLRSENSVLLNRLEKAISDSHEITKAVESPRGGSPEREIQVYKQELEKVNQKLRASQEDALKHIKAMEQAHHESLLYQNELDKMRRSHTSLPPAQDSNGLSPLRRSASPSRYGKLNEVSSLYHDQLVEKKAEIIRRRHSERVLSRSLKECPMVGRVRANIQQRKDEGNARIIQEEKEMNGSMTIQRLLRGRRDRERVNQMKAGVSRLQRCARIMLARREVRRLQALKVESGDDGEVSIPSEAVMNAMAGSLVAAVEGFEDSGRLQADAKAELLEEVKAAKTFTEELVVNEAGSTGAPVTTENKDDGDLSSGYVSDMVDSVLSETIMKMDLVTHVGSEMIRSPSGRLLAVTTKLQSASNFDDTVEVTREDPELVMLGSPTATADATINTSINTNTNSNPLGDTNALGEVIKSSVDKLVDVIRTSVDAIVQTSPRMAVGMTMADANTGVISQPTSPVYIQAPSQVQVPTQSPAESPRNVNTSSNNSVASDTQSMNSGRIHLDRTHAVNLIDPSTVVNRHVDASPRAQEEHLDKTRPAITDCVGRHFFISIEDVKMEGKVVAVDEKLKNLSVRFIVDELEDDVEELIPYNAPGIQFVNLTAPPHKRKIIRSPRSSRSPRMIKPSSIVDAVGRRVQFPDDSIGKIVGIDGNKLKFQFEDDGDDGAEKDFGIYEMKFNTKGLKWL